MKYFSVSHWSVEIQLGWKYLVSNFNRSIFWKKLSYYRPCLLRKLNSTNAFAKSEIFKYSSARVFNTNVYLVVRSVYTRYKVTSVNSWMNWRRHFFNISKKVFNFLSSSNANVGVLKLCKLNQKPYVCMIRKLNLKLWFLISRIRHIKYVLIFLILEVISKITPTVNIMLILSSKWTLP